MRKWTNKNHLKAVLRINEANKTGNNFRRKFEDFDEDQKENILVLGCVFDDLDEDQKEYILVLGCVTARNVSL